MYDPRHESRRLDFQLVLLILSLLACFVVETESFAVHQRSADALVSRHPSQSRFWAATSSASVSTTQSQTDVVLPGDAFPASQWGQISVASCNLLAPTYNSLAIADLNERQAYAEEDRQSRFPLALEMAKQSNPDILLLQEVEGGHLYEPQLQKLLGQPITLRDGTIREGYDSYLWAPLLPNRSDHVVGLCIAWRSSKHRLLASNCYKRGMVCQFIEVPNDDDPSPPPGTFAVANVHLPARPSNILGRLIAMSRTIQYLCAYDVPERASALDGLLVVGGDWNCDERSPTARLLQEGRVNYGNIRDRNYKANVSKAVAVRMKHGYRFRDVYDELRQDYAPVTVSLHGRGPGCMDHLFYTQQREGPKRRQPSEEVTKIVKLMNQRKGTGATGRRQSRREKAVRMRRASRGQSTGSASIDPHNVQTQAILATISGPGDIKRLETIHQGLPNVEAGFPSDHIPIGALFVPNPAFQDDNASFEDSLPVETSGATCDTHTSSRAVGGVSQTVRRRREAGLASLSTRRRHNVVLRSIAEWLEDNGAHEVMRDQTLYKNPWINGAKGLTKKSRAPDIICRIGKSLVVIEVTVVAAAKVESAAIQKRAKYSDLPTILPSSDAIQDAGLTVEDPMVIVLDESGGIAESTRNDIASLAKLLFPEDSEMATKQAQECCSELQALF